MEIETAPLTLGKVDTGDALAEALSRVGGETRAGLLRKAALGGTALLAALAVPSSADAGSAADVDILNYALTLEHLQAAFYTETERVGAVKGKAARAMRVVGAVERAHVQAFKNLLGRAAVKSPSFDFRGTTEDNDSFLRTAVAFEDLAVAAYKGQAPRLRSRRFLAAAVSIHSVEARHAAWMRHLVGVRPAASAFDEPRSREGVTRIVASTHFIRSNPRVTAKGTPHFTG